MEGGLYILFCRFERSKYLLNFMYFLGLEVVYV